MGPDGGFLSAGMLNVTVWGSLVAMIVLLVFSFLFFLCSACGREKKPEQQNGDHENLMNMPSDKDAFSHSVTSLGTEPIASSEQNGAVSNGDALSEDTTIACIQPYEEVQNSVTDLLDQQDNLGRSLKCHQSRELPRIPPNNATEPILSTRNAENDQGLRMEGPYEVLKDSSSQENMVEDCLYETVKEIKDLGALTNSEKNKSKATVKVAESSDHILEQKAESAEYASVNRNKKSCQNANSENPLSRTPDVEDEAPPPVPVKLLDENENVQNKGAQGEHEGTERREEPNKRLSSLIYKSREDDPSLTEDEISAMYSSINKTGQPSRDLESTYTCIPEIVPQKSPSISSGLYASVKDLESTPNLSETPQSTVIQNGDFEPDYEAIQTLSCEESNTQSVSQENDYESIGDLQQNKDVSRL